VLVEAKAYRWTKAVLPIAAVRHLLTWVSRQPAISRRRGLRGLAMDMAARKALLLELLQQATILVAPSRALAEVYAANGVTRETRIINYAHRLEWLRDLQPRRPDDRLVFGFVGRIAREKGVHVLAAATGRLSSELPLRVDVWGDPQQEPAYAAALPRSDAGRATLCFRGRFDRARVAEIYSQIDVLVVPSIWRENNPLVVQEAFAAGIPVIASDVGGIAEFVGHEVNGLLVKVGDPAALAAAMTRLATEPGLRQRLRAGTPPVRTVEQGVAEFQLLYRAAIGAHQVTA
jgi:glycosyltransferase involved in cell wall biosynthesis